MKIGKVIGANIVATRALQGVSQRALAVAAGIGQRELCAIENGRKTPTVASLNAIALALGVRPAQLVEGKAA